MRQEDGIEISYSNIGFYKEGWGWAPDLPPKSPIIFFLIFVFLHHLDADYLSSNLCGIVGGGQGAAAPENCEIAIFRETV